MAHPPQSHTAISAPGKVLLTGGYLVLDRAYTGTVFALDARIHVIVQQLSRPSAGVGGESGAGNGDGQGAGEHTGEAVEQKDGESEEDARIVVRSPQFVGAVWEYGIERVDNGGGVKVAQKNDT
jgi:phosphomevalonate kinase